MKRQFKEGIRKKERGGRDKWKGRGGEVGERWEGKFREEGGRVGKKGRGGPPECFFLEPRLDGRTYEQICYINIARQCALKAKMVLEA